MKLATSQPTDLFLQGGGELAQLILNYEWASTSVGPLVQWPQSLCTTLGIMLHSTLPMFLWWGTDQLQFYNDAFRPVLVFRNKHPTALGQPGEICWPDQWSRLKPFIDQLLAGENEEIQRHADLIAFFTNGADDEFEKADYSLVWDETGRVSGLLVICPKAIRVDKFRSKPDCMDDTVQRLTHEQRNYAQAERSFQGLFDTAPVAISVLRGPEFVLELVNQQLCAVVGRTKEQLLGKPMFDVLTESTKQGFEELLLGVMQTGVPFVGNELPVTVRRDERSQTIYINATFAPRYDLDNKIMGITIVVVEVTEQVLARHRAEASAAQLEQIFQYAPTAIGIFRGPTFIVDLANPTLCALWGRTEEQVLGKPVFAALPEAKGQGFEDLLTNVLRTGKLFQGNELPVTLNRNGQLETVYFEVIYEPFPETAAGEKRIIMTANDVTKLRQVRLQTEQLLAQERELNELKSNFVTLASHEFRTPMATILSSASLIGGYTSPQDGNNRERHVQRIKSSVYHLTGLLDDFLVISQLEKKALTGRENRLMLVVFCDELIDEMQGQLKSGQRIIYGHQEGPAVITIDELMLKNILINLLSNASKYSDDGKDIELTTIIQTNQLQISVRDWGMGIPEVDQDNVFSNFFRAQNATHIQGTGLGLYIVKRSVDLLGGTITFTSQLELGTIFTVQLPITLLSA